MIWVLETIDRSVEIAQFRFELWDVWWGIELEKKKKKDCQCLVDFHCMNYHIWAKLLGQWRTVENKVGIGGRLFLFKFIGPQIRIWCSGVNAMDIDLFGEKYTTFYCHKWHPNRSELWKFDRVFWIGQGNATSPFGIFTPWKFVCIASVFPFDTG